MTRGLKLFRIKEVEGWYYLFNENKGADQMCGYRAADLCLCFRICKMTRLNYEKKSVLNVHQRMIL